MAPDSSETITVTNFALMMRLKGDFSADQLRDALWRVRVRHPLLVIPADHSNPGGGLPDLENVPAFNLRERTGCNSDDWIEVVQEELARTSWPASGPFARFTLLRLPDASDLVAVFNHGVCEGMSGMYFLRDLIEALGNPSVEITPLPVPPASFMLIPAAVAENPKVKRQVNQAISTLKVLMWMNSLRQRFLSSTGKNAGRPRTGLHYSILAGQLTPAQTQALVERCRAEDASVQAAICTAWLQAFADSPLCRGSRVRRASVPVNIRKRLSRPIDETAGLFMSTVQVALNCRPGRDFWQAAREFKKRLEENTRDEKLFLVPLIIRTLFTRFPPAQAGRAIEFFFTRPVRYDFSITNLGRLDIPLQTGNLKVEAFYGPLVNSSEYEKTVGVSTLGDQLSLVFLFHESKMSLAQGQALMRAALERLIRYAGK